MLVSFVKLEPAGHLAIVFLLVVSITLSATPSLIGAVSASQHDSSIVGQSIQTTCGNNIKAATIAIEDGLNRPGAIMLAQNSADLKEKTLGYNSAFQSIYNSFAWDSACQVTWKNVNVVFVISNRNGYAGTFVVTENTGLSKVVSVTRQFNPQPFNYQSTSPNWEAYEFWGAHHTVNWDTPKPVYEAQGDWNVPTTTAPWSTACWWPDHCDVAPWVGLTASKGGYQPSCSSNGCIVQTGTDSYTQCSAFNCYQVNYAWYESLPQLPVTCTNISVNAGDSISGDVYSKGKIGGDANSYTASITDNTSGAGCSLIVERADMGTSWYGQFIVEKHSTTLPSFSTVTFINSHVYYDGSSKGIHNPYNIETGWYTLYTMTNKGITNAAASAVSFSDSFTATWVTSNGT